MLRLHPNLSVIYRQRVAALCASLTAGDGVEVLEAVRALVERVEVYPAAEPGGEPRLELVGALGAMLRAAGVGYPGPANDPMPEGVGPDLLWRSLKLDAGSGSSQGGARSAENRPMWRISTMKCRPRMR